MQSETDFAVVALAVVAAAAAAAVVACLGERQMELITKYDRRLNVFAVCCLISQIAKRSFFFCHFFLNFSAWVINLLCL